MNSRRFTARCLPCFATEDSTAGDLLHCGISKEPLSAVGHQPPKRSKPHDRACPLCPKSDYRRSKCDPPLSAISGLTRCSKYRLFDHLVGRGEQRGRHIEAKGLRSL